MRIPKTPPGFLNIMQEVGKNPQRLIEISSLSVEPQQKYYHWDELSYHKPPKGLSLEEWWMVIKMQRARSLTAFRLCRNYLLPLDRYVMM